MIQKFPYEDPTYDKLQEDLEKIRGKFKQVILAHKLVFEDTLFLKPLQNFVEQLLFPFCNLRKILEMR